MASNNLTGIQFRARIGNITYWINPPRTGSYPVNHPRWGEKYNDPGKEVTASSDGYFAPTHDLETIEFLSAPQRQSEIVIVWPGQDHREFPRGQVRNFGTNMTEWEVIELQKVISKIKAEDGIVDEPPVDVMKQMGRSNAEYLKKKKERMAMAE